MQLRCFRPVLPLCPRSYSDVIPLFLPTKLDDPPLPHRLCTDFGTEEERRICGGKAEENLYQTFIILIAIRGAGRA
jgi:hypothetical protein